MKPVTIMGFGPTRSAERVRAGGYIITVTPPALLNLKGASLHLTDDQYLRYQAWNEGGLLIQDALPDLTDAQREMLMTGIGDDDFHEIAKEID